MCSSLCVHSQKNIMTTVAVSLSGEYMIATIIAFCVNGSSRRVPTVLLDRFQRQDWGCLDEARGSESIL